MNNITIQEKDFPQDGWIIDMGYKIGDKKGQLAMFIRAEDFDKANIHDLVDRLHRLLNEKFQGV